MKRNQVVTQRRGRPLKPQLQPANLEDSRLHAARNGVGPNALLTMAEASVYLRNHDETCTAECRCADICRQFLQRHGVPLSHRGRTCLVRQRYLDVLVDLPPGQSFRDWLARRAVTNLSVARG